MIKLWQNLRQSYDQVLGVLRKKLCSNLLINLAIYNYIDYYEDELGVSCHSMKERTIKYAYILHVTLPGLV